MAPSGKLRLTKANKKGARISTVVLSDEIIDFNVLTDTNTAFSQSPNRNNANQTEETKMTMETTETVSTLSNGTGLITFDSFATKWNLREAVKGVLFHQKPYINDQTELEFSESNNSVCAIVLKELNISSNNETKRECWNQMKGYIPSFLNKKRTTIVQTIKKKFKGKLTTNSINMYDND